MINIIRNIILVVLIIACGAFVFKGVQLSGENGRLTYENENLRNEISDVRGDLDNTKDVLDGTRERLDDEVALKEDIIDAGSAVLEDNIELYRQTIASNIISLEVLGNASTSLYDIMRNNSLSYSQEEAIGSIIQLFAGKAGPVCEQMLIVDPNNSDIQRLNAACNDYLIWMDGLGRRIVTQEVDRQQANVDAMYNEYNVMIEILRSL